MIDYDFVAERKRIQEMVDEYKQIPRAHRAAKRRLYFKINIAMYNYDTEAMQRRYQ